MFRNAASPDSVIYRMVSSRKSQGKLEWRKYSSNIKRTRQIFFNLNTKLLIIFFCNDLFDEYVFGFYFENSNALSRYILGK